MRSLISIVMATLLLGVAAPASAQDNNAGTVKVHDNETENPPQRNVPHVQCDFWVEGFGMNDDSGTLVFLSWPPTGNKTVVIPTGAGLEWDADDEDTQGNFHFLAGPFHLPPGHYRVEVYTDDGHPGNGSHFAKTKTFWVECDSLANPPCPPGLVALAPAEGGVRLNWTAEEDVTYLVYRAEGQGEFGLLAVVDGGSYTDTTTVGGVTYSYYVTAIVGDRESVGCQMVTVTTVPFFGGPVLAMLALGGAVLAYVALRRRG